MLEFVVKNAKFYDPLNGFLKCKYLGVSKGKLRLIDEENIAESVKILNAENKFLMPAFNDSHIHIWKVGSLLTHILDVRDVTCIDELLSKMSDRLKTTDNGSWLIARGVNELKLKEKRLPTAKDLDKISKTIPIYLVRTCAHIAMVNSLVLKKLSIKKMPISPAGGVIYKDEKGNPLGIFADNALSLIEKLLPKYSASDYELMLDSATKLLHKNGITAATDPAVHPELLSVYKKSNAENKIKLRLNAIPILVSEGGNKILPFTELFESDCLKIDTVKFFADGGLSGKTAAMKRNYKNSDDKGILRLTEDFFLPIAKEVANRKFKIATHAIGDAALEVVINVYKKIKSIDLNLRHRLEHVGFPTIGNLKDIRLNNISVVMQPIFMYELADNFELYLDKEYMKNVYPFKSVFSSGINFSFSTDAPVVKNLNPLQCIQTAIDRKSISGKTYSLEQCVELKTALKAYTYGSAYVNNDELSLGRLENNYHADFIILDKNPFEVEPDTISKIQVEKTFFAGKEVYSLR